MILTNRAFCANLLHERQQDLSDLFSGRKKTDPAQRFDKTPWNFGEMGPPVLTGPTASFECELGTNVLRETHYILVGKVIKVHLSNDPAALIYGQRDDRRAMSLRKE